MATLNVEMVTVTVTKHGKHVQRTVTLQVSVMMVMSLTVLVMVIAVQSHGLVMALKIAKIKLGVVI